MTGVSFLGLVLLSMAWFFFVGGAALNWAVFRKKQVRAGLGFLPGVVGSLAVFFTLPVLREHGLEAPWPWLWIALPFVLDPGCLGGFLVLAYRRSREKPN